MSKGKSIAALLALVITILCGSATETPACRCGPPPPPCVAFGHAAAVFIGRAVSGTVVEKHKTYTSYSGEVSFEVHEVFSGVKSNSVRVWDSGRPCSGILFEAGQTYLVYAYEDADKKLFVRGCGRTKSITIPDYLGSRGEAELAEDLKFLRSLPQSGSGAHLYGEVVTRGEPFNNEPETAKPLADVPVRIQGEQKTIELKTDSNGKFDLAGLTPGNYQVEIMPPAGYLETGYGGLKRELHLNDRGCGEAKFYLDVNGVIRGQVFDNHGRPVSKVEVQLISADWQNKEIKDDTLRSFEMKRDTTDQEGKYEIAPLPPGRYLLGVSLSRPGPNTPYRRTFYPGVSDVAQAMEIVLGVGQKLSSFDFYLKPELEVHTIQGKVVWPDGTPVAGAEVNLRNSALSFSNDEDSVETDEQGRFRIKGLKGHRYRLDVYWRSGISISGKSKAGPAGVSFAESETRILTITGDVNDFKVVLSNTKQQ